MKADDTLRWLTDELSEGHTRPLEELADELRRRRLTLVRCWRGFHDERPSAFVDWNAGEFDIPRDHPLAVELWGSLADISLGGYLLTVFSTDELIWTVDKIEAYRSRDEYHVSCAPYVERVRGGLTSDEYMIHMWLEAEKRLT
jgi:hypothetical protein